MNCFANQTHLNSSFRFQTNCNSKLISREHLLAAREPDEFNDIASGGSKATNLGIVKRLAQNYNQTKRDFEISVPEFTFISNQDMKEYLKKQAIDLDGCWKMLVQKYYPQENDRLQAIASGTLSQDFLNAAEVLAKQVLQAFADITHEDIGLLSGDTAAFILNASKNEKSLIVRSTGQEDTEQVCNAGGNTSVQNVRPLKKDLLHSIGTVASSYISTKSLMQRIDAHDSSIFDTPFIPVLLQHMIGEPQGGFTSQEHILIPRCGVLYTCEQQGKTPDVVHIEATCGSNEAVVNPEHQTQIAIDTYYIGQSGLIHASIKPKHSRLVPGSDGLDYAKNPENLTYASSLSKTAVEQLYLFAQAVESYFGCPQDIEFILDESSKTIHIVQTRPHQKKNFDVTPQYLTSIDTIPAHSIVTGKTNILGDGKVSLITSPDQIIVSTTLAKALEEYQNPNRPKHPAGTFAFIQNWSGQLSHAAAVFTNQNIKTIATPHTHLIEAWMHEPDLFLIVDIQRGVVINGKDIQCFADKSIDSSLIQQNWLNHPMSIQNSILPWNAERACGGLLGQILQQFPADLSGKYTLLNKQEITGCLEKLKECPVTQIEQHLITLLSHAYGLLYQQRQQLGKLHQANDEPLKSTLFFRHVAHAQALNDLFQLILASANELLASAKSVHAGTGVYTLNDLGSRSMQRLYPLKQLENLFLQQSHTTALDVHSLASIDIQHTELLQFIDTCIKPLLQENCNLDALLASPSQLGVAHIGVRAALSPAVEKAWIVFVNHVCANPDLLPKFTALIETIKKLGILPSWINISFAQSYKKNVNYCLTDLCGELEQGTVFLEPISSLKQYCLQQDLSAWQNPKYFTQNWNQFLKIVHTPFVSGIFADKDKFIQLSPLVACAAISAMNLFVDTFDSMIKSVKSSRQYSSDEVLVATFKQMVQSYFSLVISWGKLLPSNYFPHDDPFADSDENSEQLSQEDSLTVDEDSFTDSDEDFEKFFQKTSFEADRAPSTDNGENFEELFQKDLFAIDEDQFLVSDKNFKKPSQKDSLTIYVSIIKKIIDNAPLENSQLFPTKGFSGLAAAFGSAGDIRDFRPETLEDCFAATHGSLNNISGALIKPYYSSLDLPERLSSIDKQMHSVDDTTCFGLSFDSDSFSLLYNTPLDGHGAQFKVAFDKRKNYTELECRLFCNPWSAREDRLFKSLNYLKLFGALENYIIATEEISKLAMRCILHIPSTALIDNIAIAINYMLDSTKWIVSREKGYVDKRINDILDASENRIKETLGVLIEHLLGDVLYLDDVIRIFKKKKSDRLPLVFDYLQSLINENNLLVSCTILQCLIENKIPLANENIHRLANIMEQTKLLFPVGIKYAQDAQVLQIILAIAPEEQPCFIDQVRLLFSDVTIIGSIVKILQIILSIAPEKRSHVIDQTKLLTNGLRMGVTWIRKILQALQAIPFEQLSSIVEQAKLLITNRMSYDEIIKILQTIQAIPPELRSGIIEQIKPLPTDEIDGIVKAIEALTLG